MASNIVPGNVDGTFPKAGQDNSSQGFRDNFSSIKNNFTEAKTEIEAGCILKLGVKWRKFDILRVKCS